MSAPGGHPVEALHDALDGRLDDRGRVELTAHLATCADCRREFEGLSALKRQLGTQLQAETPIPDDLEARLRQALDDEDRRRGSSIPAGRTQRAASRRWVVWAAAAAASLALVFTWVERRSTSVAPTEVAQDLRRYMAGDFVLDTRTTDVGDLERRLGVASLGFPTRVFDFGMMAYRLEGGGVHQVAGRPSALFAYVGAESLRLLCQMYEGTVTSLPPPTERRTNEGIDFLVYRDGDVTVVFWQEGDVVCALAANGDAEAAIRLAFAKAIRA